MQSQLIMTDLTKKKKFSSKAVCSWGVLVHANISRVFSSRLPLFQKAFDMVVSRRWRGSARVCQAAIHAHRHKGPPQTQKLVGSPFYSKLIDNNII